MRNHLKTLAGISLLFAASALQAEPLQLGAVPWPTIHQSSRGGKSSLLPGPVPGAVEVHHFATDNEGINQLHGRNFFYFQEMGTGLIKAYRLDTMDMTGVPEHQFNLKASYPFSGGGLIDNRQRLWWTTPNQLVRLDEDLSHPVFSEAFPNISSWNGLNFLPDGNMLVTSMGSAALIVSTEPAILSPTKEPKFLIRTRIDMRDITWKGVRILSDQTFTPSRPVTDLAGAFYIVAGRYLLRWEFDSNTRSMKKEFTWAYRVSDGEDPLGSSNAVVTGNRVCANSLPPGGSTISSTVHCVTQAEGRLVFKSIPFPDAKGSPGMHNLGFSVSRGLLIFLSGTKDGKGGLAALRLSDGSIAWRLPLAEVSNAFALSDTSGFLYVSDMATGSGISRFLAVDLSDGAENVLFSVPTAAGPNSSLWAIGKDGDVFAPVEGGFYRIRNR